MKERLVTDSTRFMNLDVGTLAGLVYSFPREVAKSTYEVISEISRYDQRDHVTARSRLKPQTKEYEDYYKKHPEKEEVDTIRRKMRSNSHKQRSTSDEINDQLAQALFFGRTILGVPQIVTGDLEKLFNIKKETKEKVEADPVSMAKKIKAMGLYLGAQKVRVTELNQNWVYSHYAHPYTPEPYGKPVDLNYKYIICLAFWQDPHIIATGTKIAQNIEVYWKYAYASFIAVMIAQFIRSLGWPARALTSDNSPYLVPPVFVDAGIGEYGRCGYVVTKEFGNNFRPSAIATDMPLTIDKPVDFGLQDFCTKCKICAEACPSRAIPFGDMEIVRGVRKWQIDPEKCRSYWDKIGRSCSICQSVCPWNHLNNWWHNGIRELADKFKGVRNILIKGEKLAYGKFKAGQNPDWLKN